MAARSKSEQKIYPSFQTKVTNN